MRAQHAGFMSVIVLALMLVGACATPLSANGVHTATPKPTATATAVVGPGCNPPSPVTSSANAFPEVHGQASNGELWALLFNTLHAKQEIKIVWRMTGTGDLHLIAQGPQEQRLAPVWGPEAHGGSNWNRPGAEWGAGFTFPVAGCWDIHATRDDNAGDVWLRIN
ncbi:MAG TPA: hypothetical protein VF510_08625 [Ktedonobacterales bacterium]